VDPPGQSAGREGRRATMMAARIAGSWLRNLILIHATPCRSPHRKECGFLPISRVAVGFFALFSDAPRLTESTNDP
jgi:hypothetical protein